MTSMPAQPPIALTPLPPSRHQRRSPHEELRQSRRPDHFRAGHGLSDLLTRRPGEALMSQNVIDVVILVVLLAISTPLLGSYMAKVFQNKKAPGDRVRLPRRTVGAGVGPIVVTSCSNRRTPKCSIYVGPKLDARLLANSSGTPNTM